MESLSGDLKDWLKPELIWFVVGLIFLLVEFAHPGVIIVFFGLGAWLVALLSLFLDFSVNLQLVIFILSSLMLLIIFRRKFQSLFHKQQDNEMDETDAEFIGKKARVIEEISPNKDGKIEFRGTQWEAEAEETLKKGTAVEIIDKRSITLKVKSI